MPNVNSVCDVIYQQNNGNPIVMTVTTPIHQAFQIGSGNAIATVPNPQALIESAVAFPGRSAQAIPFVIRAAGLVTFSARGKAFQIDINQGTGIATQIATTGLFTTPLGAGSYNDNWCLEVLCMWDSASTQLRGTFDGWVGGTVITHKMLNSAPAPANLAALQFTVGVTVNDPTVVAPTTFTLTEFSIALGY